jgi:hypothetical protein
MRTISFCKGQLLSKRSGQAHVIAVVAGRRIDLDDATLTEFPLSEISRVRSEIAATLQRMKVDLLFGSAACGSDILALQAAESTGTRAKIVLPCDVERFMQEAVTDRPGDWSSEYTRLIAQAAERGDLHIVDASNARDPYLANNLAVMSKAEAVSFARRVGIFVWNGISKGRKDATADLHRLAKHAGFELVDISPSVKS